MPKIQHQKQKEQLMKKYLSVTVTLLILLTSACHTIKELPQDPKAPVKDPEYALAQKLLIHCLNNDAEKFIKVLPPKKQQEFTVKQFHDTTKNIADTFGRPESFPFLTKQSLPIYNRYVWKICFRKTNRQSEEFTSEILFRVTTVMQDGKPVISGFQFF